MTHSLSHNIPLEWICAFKAAGRLGSFTAAARETGLTQAAISQRISHLEHRIGTQLLLRKARGVVLTVDGESWLPYVSSALTTLHESAQELFSIERRHYTLSASNSITDLWIIPRLENLPADEALQFSFRTIVLSADASQQGEGMIIRYGAGDWSWRSKSPLYKE